jgi:hypothetical protein
MVFAGAYLPYYSETLGLYDFDSECSKIFGYFLLGPPDPGRHFARGGTIAAKVEALLAECAKHEGFVPPYFVSVFLTTR